MHLNPKFATSFKATGSLSFSLLFFSFFLFFLLFAKKLKMQKNQSKMNRMHSICFCWVKHVSASLRGENRSRILSRTRSETMYDAYLSIIEHKRIFYMLGMHFTYTRNSHQDKRWNHEFYISCNNDREKIHVIRLTLLLSLKQLHMAPLRRH